MRIRPFFTRIVLAALACILTISCNSPSTDLTTSGAAPNGALKVAMLMSGSKSDGSWSQGGYEGLRLIEKQYNAQVTYQENMPEADSEDIIRQYAKDGYDFIIGHSGGYAEPAEVVAEEFPNTKFAVVTTYPGNNKNLGAVAFRSGEVGYLSGMLAAMKSKTGKVAYIVGYDYPVYQEEAALFERGVKATNPNVEVSTHFLQSWTDGEKATQLALDLVASGVDILALNADEAGIAALEAITEKEGVYIIGWTKDQHDKAPGHVITSVLQDIPQLVLNSATLVQEGRWEGKLYKFGLREKIYDFAPFRGMLTPEEEAAFNVAKEKVMAGEIDISP